jgi:predicted aspartyl protease
MKVTRFLTACMVVILSGFATFAQQKGQVVEVPFEFTHNEIIVQVKVNGHGPFNMLLDTGTDPSAIDFATAKKLGLKLSSAGGPVSGGGTDKNVAYETRLPLIETGDLSVKNVVALALDLSKVAERLGKPLQGVLGHSLLNGRIVQIDYANRVVRFYSHSPFTKADSTSKRTVLPFHYDDNVLIDDVFVNGKKVVGNLDTGSSGNFSLTPAAVTYLGLEEEVSRAQVSTSVGFNNLSQNREGKVSNVTIGKISVDGPTVVFFGKGTGRDKKPWGVNIGNEFFKDFVLTIDYRNKLVTFERL